MWTGLELARELGPRAFALQVDLASADGVEQLWSRIGTMGRVVDVMAINAGIGVGGAFVENALAKEINLINLNITGTVHLAKRAAVEMVSRGSGRILFTSSIASQMPGPFYAVYAASKPPRSRARVSRPCLPTRTRSSRPA